MCSLLRAYALGYISVTGPKVFGALKLFRQRGEQRRQILQKVVTPLRIIHW
jgi:hypothetical protein